MTLRPVAQVLVVVTLAWGVLAFGAVYPWASRTLAGLAAAAGLVSLGAGRTAGPRLNALLAAGALVLVCVGLQIVPMPPEWLIRLSPGALEVMAARDLTFVSPIWSRYTLSIDPAATRESLVLLTAFALFLVGMTRLLSTVGVRWLLRAVAVLATAIALIGIVQNAMHNGKVYGFWTPTFAGAEPFGPFINKNHFAGWMLMAVPVSLALLAGGIAHGVSRIRPDWHHRLLWLASKQANQLVLLSGGIVLMSLSLVLTMSRSGIIAFTMTLASTILVALARVGTGSRRFAVSLSLAALFCVAVGWVGLDAIANRFDQTDWRQLNSRRGAWADALSIARRFPATGTGMNTYGTATLLYQTHDTTRHYSQAHNDYLELLSEGGALVAVPVALLLVVFIREARARLREPVQSETSWWARVGALTGLAAIAAQETVDFSLQMPGNAVLCAALCAVALHRTPIDRGSKTAARPPDTAGASFACGTIRPFIRRH
jgi:O-antigen ligase